MVKPTRRNLGYANQHIDSKSDHAKAAEALVRVIKMKEEDFELK